MYCIIYRYKGMDHWNIRTQVIFSDPQIAWAHIGKIRNYDTTPTEYAVAALTVEQE